MYGRRMLGYRRDGLFSPVGIATEPEPEPESDIVNVQRGTITLAPTVTTATATITAVDLTKSIVILTGSKISGASQDPRDCTAWIGFDSSTTVRITRGNTPSGTFVVSFEVITFSNVASIQHHLILIPNGSDDASVTLSPAIADFAKAAIFDSGMLIPSAIWSNALHILEFTSTTALRASRGPGAGSNDAYTFAWVVQFN